VLRSIEADLIYASENLAVCLQRATKGAALAL
jgi:hypothetical protein